MRQWVVIATILLFLTGCNTANNATSQKDKIENQLNPAKNADVTQKGEKYNKIDYVHFKTKRQHTTRQKIRQSILKHDAISDAAIQSIGDKVFIAYQPSQATNEKIAKGIIDNIVHAQLPQGKTIYTSNKKDILNKLKQYDNRKMDKQMVEHLTHTMNESQVIYHTSTP